MKNMKRIFSLVLALVMMMALTVAAGAADPESKSITMTNAVKGSTYNIYKLFDAEYNESTKSVSYTIDKAAHATWYGLVNGAGSPFDASAKKGTTGEVYYVTVKDGKTETEVIDWLKANYTAGNLTVAQEQKTATADGSITWTLNDYGYYLIVSSNGTDAAVTIDTNAPHATVIAKNEKPGWGNGGKVIIGADGKETTLNSVNIGDTVNFKIFTDSAKNYDGQDPITKYTFTDKMSENLQFNANSLEVKVNNRKLESTEYTLKTEELAAGVTFEVEITWGTITKDADSADVYTPKFTEVNNTVEITYSATVKATAPANTALKNTAEISWNDKTIDVPGKDTETYVYDFDIKKYTTNNGQKVDLTGAEFTLHKDSATGEAVKFTQDGSGNYKYDVSGTPTLTAGNVNVYGLKAGVYYLEETKAPNGYNKLTEAIKVEIIQNADKSKTIEVNGTELGGENKVVEVENNTGTELPATGGIGTTIFTVTGGLLMIGAAILFLTKKRSEG